MFALTYLGLRNRQTARNLGRILCGALISLFVVLGATHSNTAQAVTGCGFNVDALALTDPNAAASSDLTSDGLLIARYVRGLTGTALIKGTRVDQTPANLTTVTAAITAHMTAYRGAHDIDASGIVDSNDTLIISRYLAGYRGASLTNGLGLTGSRNAFADVQTYIANGCVTAATPTISINAPSTPQIITIGQTISLTANALDADGWVTSIVFLVNGAPVSGLSCNYATTSNPRTCTVNWTPGAVGSYSLTAIATDNSGLSTTISTLNARSVTVSPLTPPSGCSISGPTSLAATASGSWSVSCTGGSPVTSYSWSRSPAGFTAATQSIVDTPFPSVTPTSATYSVTVGNSAGSASVSITVQNTTINTAPTAQVFALNSPANAIVQMGNPVVFGFTVYDPDPGQSLGVILVRDSVNGFADGSYMVTTSASSGSAQSGTITWTPVIGQDAAGTHIFRLQVYDGFLLRSSVNTISITVTSETLTFIHPSITGSPMMASDSAGKVVWREDYSAFGERKKNEANANAGVAANQNWFIGKPQDTQTGLVYFGNRWYDPLTGRFISFDPAGVDEHNPHSFNRYAYGNNNPYKFVDPDGRAVFLIPLVAAAIEAAPAIAATASVGYAAARAAPGVQRAVAAAMNTVNSLAAHPATVSAIETMASIFSGTPNPISLAPSAATNIVYQTAKSGGRYAGFIANYASRSVREIEKAIRSHEAQVAEHAAKIANPAGVKGLRNEWSKIDPREQAAMINGWHKDMQNNAERAEALKGLLQDVTGK